MVKKLYLTALMACVATAANAKDLTTPTGTISAPTSQAYAAATKGLSDLQAAVEALRAIPLTGATPETVKGINDSIKDIEQKITIENKVKN